MGPLSSTLLLRFSFFPTFPENYSHSLTISHSNQKMDSTDFENMKPEKAKALLHRYLRYRSVGFLFRVTEICFALLFLWWLFTCLPFLIHISGEFLRRLAFFISTPLFMFFLGNSIIVTLLTTKSTVFSSGWAAGGVEADIYEALINSGDNRANSSDGDPREEETIVYDDKQIVATETDSNSNSAVARVDHAIIETEEDSKAVIEPVKDEPPTNVYRRSKSEISSKQSPEIVSKPSLQRSETEKCRKITESCEEIPFPEDNLSNEEFQKTIEAFIAKQLVFRRQESLAVVIHNKI